MYLSSQRFFKTPHKILKFKENLLLLQTKKGNKHVRMKVSLFCFQLVKDALV